MTLNKLFELYRKSFVPIYSDYVSLTATKPEQVLIEEENILSHISQSCNPSLPRELQKANLEKAQNHLVRVILDVHKLVWVETKKKLDHFVLSRHHRPAFNIKESEVLKRYQQFHKKGRAARIHEMQNIGNNPLSSIKFYEEVNAIGNELLGELDEIKANTINNWLAIIKTKKFLLGMLTGVLASFIASFLYNKIF